MNHVNFESFLYSSWEEMNTKRTISVLFLLWPGVFFKEIDDRFPYRFIHNPDCYRRTTGRDIIRLTVIVKSEVPSFYQRTVIRNTWGYENQSIPNVSIRTVFNIGIPNSRLKLNLENEIYHDIIQSDFLDTYWNLTTKTVMGIKWAVQMCKSSDFFLFVNDDVLVVLKRFMEYIRDYKLDKNDLIYMGFVPPPASRIPLRENVSKHYISYEEYERLDYPPYVSGGAVAFSRSGLDKMYRGIKHAQYLKFEDAFMGLAAEQVGLKPRHVWTVNLLKKMDISRVYYFKYAIAAHFHDTSLIEIFWDLINEKGFLEN